MPFLHLKFLWQTYGGFVLIFGSYCYTFCAGQLFLLPYLAAFGMQSWPLFWVTPFFGLWYVCVCTCTMNYSHFAILYATDFTSIISYNIIIKPCLLLNKFQLQEVTRLTKKFKVIDAQVWSEDRVVNYNIFQLQAWA